MPDYTEALKEAYASATGGVILNTLELSHPALEESLFLVQDFTSHTFTLEDETEQVFQPAPFRFTLPASGANGLQELNIAIDNVDQQVSDFLAALEGDPEPVLVRLRTYLSTHKEEPQNGLPLSLYLADIRVNNIECTGRAAFADIINRPFLSILYTGTRFPGLQ